MKKVMTFLALVIFVFSVFLVLPALSQEDKAVETARYACKKDLIEVLFAPETQVRMRDGQPVDLGASKGMSGVDEVLTEAAPYSWYRPTDIPEATIDGWQARGEEKSGQPVYNLNNMYRLRINPDADIWSVCADLEALPGVMNARPMPLPTPPPAVFPYDYEPQQGYLYPASSTPTGIDAHYAWSQIGGMGDGVTICDIEYSWNYNHADLTKLPGSQINPSQIIDPFPARRAFHGTAVVGVLVSDDNGWGTTGISHMSNILTCGSYYEQLIDPPDTVWDVPGAIMLAINNLSAGDVILLEHQWDYNDPNTGTTDYIPIEWWTDTYPNAQTQNGVFGAIQNAISNGIHVVEAGGNGGAPTLNTGYNTDNLTWFGNSGAIIVGAGGAISGGQWPEGDLERISWSSYGGRYDLQGWGEHVVTTGYGDLDSSWGYNYMYTNSFDGTSSASPVVAGAVACCVGYWMGQGFTASSLTPANLRDILKTTGTPQVNLVGDTIGPRPDLQAAFAALTVEWTDVTAPPCDNYDQHAFGSAWGDYDGDGFLDLYVSNNNNPNKLFRNTGPTFVDASGAPVDDGNVGYGVAWGDYDNDGDLDLFLANNGAPNKLFRNDGGGVFTDVTTSPIDDPAGASSHVSWVDYDNDGDIDLYVTALGTPNYLFRNDGGGSFTDVSSGAPIGYIGASGGADWGDYDNDGDMDVYLACYYGQANHLFRNDGGTFTDVTAPPLNHPGEGTGVAWGDYDGDGDLDLYVVNNGQPNKMFENKGGYFVDASVPPLDDAASGISAGWADYDNDGDLDLFVTNAYSQNKLYRNDGPGIFVDNTTATIIDNGYGFGFSWGDYDSDGDLDIYLPNAGSWEYCKLYRNEIGDDNHWFKVDLAGVISNYNGIGARVHIYVGGNHQFRDVTSGSGFCSMHSLTTEFGVGSATWIDSLIVDWPSGTHQALVGVNVDNHIELVEPTGGSDICGDANSDGTVNVSDAVFLINYIFKGGPAPSPLCIGDANYDGSVNVSDAVYLVSYIFQGGPAPNPNCCGK